MFEPMPIAAHLLWVDRLGEEKSIRRKELCTLPHVHQLIAAIFNAADLTDEEVTDISHKSGWTRAFHQWRDYRTRKKPGFLDVHIQNKAYASDFVYAADPKNPTETEKRKTEFIHSRLPECIFSSSPGDAIYKRKPPKPSSKEENGGTHEDETGETTTKRTKFDLPSIPPGLCAEEREEFLNLFGMEEEDFQ